MKTLDISAIVPTKENIAKVLEEINGERFISTELTQDEIDQLTHDKRVEEAEQADRSYMEEELYDGEK